MSLIIILAAVLLIGALLGGNSFGQSIRKGCGFFFWILIFAIIAAAVFSVMALL